MVKNNRIAGSVGLAVLSVLALLFAGGCRFHGGGGRGSDVVSQQVKALESEPWSQPNQPLVEVNGKTITRGDFYRRILKYFGTRKLLHGMVRQEIFLQAAEQLNLSVSQEEIDARVGIILERFADEMGGRDKLAEAHRRQGLSEEDVIEDLRRDVQNELLIAEVTKAHREISDEDVRDLYKRMYRYKRYVTRHIAYSFRPPSDRPNADPNALKLEAFNRAARAADRVRKGADFAELARAESEDSATSRNGGRLGPIHRDAPMAPAMKEAIFKLAPGEVSPPVENPEGGYHIFQVTEILPGESFADCRDKIRQHLLEREPTLEEIERTFERLHRRADVRLIDPQLAPEPVHTPPLGGEGGNAPGAGVGAVAPESQAGADSSLAGGSGATAANEK